MPSYIPYLKHFVFCDEWFVTVSCDSPEGTLYFRNGLYIFCLTTDHEGHVILQCNVAIPACTEQSVCTGQSACTEQSACIE